MKKYCVLLLAMMILYSCGINPEKEYGKILSQTNDELVALHNKVGELSTYEITTKVTEISMQYESLTSDLYSKVMDNEKKSAVLSEIIQSFEDIESYKEIVKFLENKNIELFKTIQDIKWINAGTNDIESIFSIDAQKLSFVNLSNTFDYNISAGNFTFNYGTLYLSLENDELIIKDDFGNTAKYRKATEADLLLGKWKNPNTWGGRWGGIGFILQNQ